MPPMFSMFTKLAAYRNVILIAMGVVLVVVVISHLSTARRRRLSTSFGASRWATRREIIQAGLLGSRGVMLGLYQGRYVRDDSEAHIKLVGPTRMKKGVGPIICTLLTWLESVLVTDPKDGENYEVTKAWREGLGPVHAFTPCKTPHTRINVLDNIRLRTPREFGDAQLIAQSLVAPEKIARENQTSLHFRELASHLLTAAILHVLYTGRRKSLAGVWQFLTQEHANLGACLKTMTSTRHLSQGVHEAIASMTRAISNITGDRELSSVWSTAIRPLVLYNDPLIAASTDASDFAIDDLQYGERPMSLYLIAPSPMELERLHPLFRVILEVAMSRLMEHKVRTWKHRLLGVFDEICWFGYMRTLEKGIATKAGYGMKDLLVSQDLESWWDVYGPHTAIWGNCTVRVFFAPANDLTAKRISENILGTGTVEEESHQSGQTGNRGTASTTSHFHSRLLMTAQELMGLATTKELVCMSGCWPFIAEKIDYRADKALSCRAL